MLHDEIFNACRKAGFEPVPGQQAPQLSSVVNLVSAEFGVSIVPASVSQIRAEGVVYADIADAKVVTNLALASRDAEPSAKVANFLALAEQARSAAAAGGKRPGGKPAPRAALKSAPG